MVEAVGQVLKTGIENWYLIDVSGQICVNEVALFLELFSDGMI